MPRTSNEFNEDEIRWEASVNLSTKLLSTQEVARLLVVPVSTLYTWRYKDTGPRACKVGKHLRYRLHDVMAWLDKAAER